MRSALLKSIILTVVLQTTVAERYVEAIKLLQNKLSGHYDTRVRPKKNLSEVLFVDIAFQIVSIFEVKEVSSAFTVNGLLAFTWVDEIVAWNKESYDGQCTIHPFPHDIWRPMVFLLNTIDKRDPFKEDKAPLFVHEDGTSHWVPGSLFSSTCQLDMTNFPFDQHTCALKLGAMYHSTQELQFRSIHESALTDYYVEKGEWNLIGSSIKTNIKTFAYINMSQFNIEFTFKRRPSFTLYTIVYPTVFISFLDVIVFLIPKESGEKIIYGVTVLLTELVFMNSVKSMLPRTSSMSKLAMYLFSLVTISVLTVFQTIVFIYLECRAEKRLLLEQRKRTNTAINTGVDSFNNQQPTESEMPTLTSRKRVTLEKIKLISEIVLSLAWISVTLVFFLSVSL